MTELRRNWFVLAGGAGRLDEGRFHIFQRNIAQLDLLGAKTIEHCPHQVVFRNGSAGALTYGFADLVVHHGNLLEHGSISRPLGASGLFAKCTSVLDYSRRA